MALIKWLQSLTGVAAAKNDPVPAVAAPPKAAPAHERQPGRSVTSVIVPIPRPAPAPDPKDFTRTRDARGGVVFMPRAGSLYYSPRTDEFLRCISADGRFQDVLTGRTVSVVWGPDTHTQFIKQEGDDVETR